MRVHVLEGTGAQQGLGETHAIRRPSIQTFPQRQEELQKVSLMREVSPASPLFRFDTRPPPRAPDGRKTDTC